MEATQQAPRLQMLPALSHDTPGRRPRQTMARSGLGDRSRSSLGQKTLPRTRPRLMLSVLSRGRETPYVFRVFLRSPEVKPKMFQGLGKTLPHPTSAPLGQSSREKVILAVGRIG